jgi:hypothetical protein
MSRTVNSLITNPLSVLVGVLCLSLTIGCSSIPEIDVPRTDVDAPEGEYINLTMLSDEIWVVSKWEGDGSNDRGLWLMTDDGQEIEPIETGHPRDDCHTVRPIDPKLMPDGRVAFRNTCLRHSLHNLSYLSAWDSHSGETSLLFDYPLPNGKSDFTFDPKSEDVLSSTNDASTGDMYLLTELTSYLQKYDMDKAIRPSWSPDGTSIALFGNEEISGEWGPGWAHKPTHIWVMNARCIFLSGSACVRERRSIVDGITEIGTISWAPDSSQFVFDGKIEGSDGVFIYNLKQMN